LAWFATVCVALLASLVCGAPSRKSLQGLTWWSAMRGEERAS
jgi:hypothetical protein